MTPEQQRAIAIAQAAAAAAAAGGGTTAASSSAAPAAFDPMFPRATGGPLPSVPGGQGRGANYPPVSGAILPYSSDQTGAIRFDPNAGVLGFLGRSLSLPADVYAGKVDPLSPQGVDRAIGLGTMVMPDLAAGGFAATGPRDVVQAPVKPPTSEQLLQAGGAQLDTARGMGVDYSSKAIQDVAQAVQARMESEGILGVSAKKTFKILGDLQSPPEGSVASFTGVVAARQALNRIIRDKRGTTEAEAAGRAIDALDSFLENPPGGSVLAGDAQAAAELHGQGIANYAAGKRSDKLQGVDYSADLGTAATGSGLNTDNAIRQRVKSFLLNPKSRAGLSPDEIVLLEGVVRGTATRNTLRYVGNWLGGGGGLPSALLSVGSGITSFLAHPSMEAPVMGLAAPTVAGIGIKNVANALTSRALNAADEAIRTRAPLYSDMQAAVPWTTNAANRQAEIARILLLKQQQANQPVPVGQPVY